MQIVNNAVHPVLFQRIKSEITSNRFSWAHGLTTDNDVSLFGNSFSNNIFVDDGTMQHEVRPMSYLCNMALAMVCYDIGVELDKVLRIRAGLITVTQDTYYHSPHVDYLGQHYTAILYLNKCNGVTQFYNEIYDGNVPNNLTIKDEITPEDNKFVIFDGCRYHNSSTPTDVSARYAINFNFITK